MLNLEGIEQKFEDTYNSESFQQIQKLFNEKQNILLIGNGGNYAVAQHGAADCSRLTSKNVMSFDSPTWITSIANDNGYEDLFLKWISTLYAKKVFTKEDAFVIDCILNTEHFHTAEILSLILFYELVEGAGECCPLIDDEKDRRSKLKCNFDNLTPYVKD